MLVSPVLIRVLLLCSDVAFLPLVQLYQHTPSHRFPSGFRLPPRLHRAHATPTLTDYAVLLEHLLQVQVGQPGQMSSLIWEALSIVISL